MQRASWLRAYRGRCRSRRAMNSGDRLTPFGRPGILSGTREAGVSSTCCRLKRQCSPQREESLPQIVRASAALGWRARSSFHCHLFVSVRSAFSFVRDQPTHALSILAAPNNLGPAILAVILELCVVHDVSSRPSCHSPTTPSRLPPSSTEGTIPAPCHSCHPACRLRPMRSRAPVSRSAARAAANADISGGFGAEACDMCAGLARRRIAYRHSHRFSADHRDRPD